MLPGGSYSIPVERQPVGAIPVERQSGRRFRVVLRGAALSMALVAAAAVLSRQRTAATSLEVSPNPNITKTVGPSQKQWMAWENAHGLPKECTPTKEVSVGPHGEEVFTYYADCSMYAKDAVALKMARKASSKRNQGIVATALVGKKPAPFRKKVMQEASQLIAHNQARANALIVDPDSGAAKKDAARKALSKKASTASAPAKNSVSSSTKDLEPPALPSMLQRPKRRVKATAAIKPQTSSQGHKTVPRSKTRAVSGPMWQPAPFQKKVVKEAAKFWQTDKARADALIVDPDADVANGGVNVKAKPVPKLARLAAKASGPAAAILEMVSGARSLE